MNVELLQATYDLVDEIKENQYYKRYIFLHKVIETDEEILELIRVFVKSKDKYEEAQKYGKYHPDLKQIQLDLKEAKENVYNNDIIKEYKACEQEIQSILNTVSRELAQAVSSKIKHPNPLGLINKH